MPKTPKKTNMNGPKKDVVAAVIADKYGLTTSMVRKVRDGERSNDAVFDDYMTLSEGWNKLIAAVEKAVPFEVVTVHH